MSKSCKSCGKDMPDEANICLYCLTEYNDGSEPAPIASKRLNKKHVAAIVSAALCALIILPLAIYPLYESKAMHATAQSENSGEAQEKPKSPLDKVEEFFSEAFAPDSHNENEGDEAGQSAADPASNQSGENGLPALEDSTTGAANNAPSSGAPNMPGTTKPSTTKPTTTKPAAPEKPVLNVNDYEYVAEGKGVCITKYKGNDSNIIIPDKIDGKNVVRIDTYAFKDNSKLTYVTFKDSTESRTLWVNPQAFYNCSSLKKITFPKKTDLGILHAFAVFCPQFEDIEIDHWQYRFIDGALYYSNTQYWTLQCYCEGYKSESLTIPGFCSHIDCEFQDYGNLRNNKYLKKIYLNDRNLYPYPNYGTFNYIEGIYAPDENQILYDINGVLFERGEGKDILRFYPVKCTQKEFKLPSNAYVSFTYNTKNDYLQVLDIPAGARFDERDIEYINNYFKNVKTIKISKSNPQLQRWKDTFIGTVTVY